jgi:hypothetical protein
MNDVYEPILPTAAEMMRKVSGGLHVRLTHYSLATAQSRSRHREAARRQSKMPAVPQVKLRP